MRRVRLAGAALAASWLLVLSGCVTTAPRVAGGLWTGRLAVRSEATGDLPARSDTGTFELSGSAQHGQLVLTSPLGTVAARASWSLHRGAGVTGVGAAGAGRGMDADARDVIELDTGGGPRRYATLDDMMVDATGNALPLAAMFDWLAGRPWLGAPAQPLPEGRPGFVQLGWTVDLSRFGEDRLIAADRAEPPPALHVRVKLDTPGPAPGPAPAPSPSLAPAPGSLSSSAPDAASTPR